MYTLTKNFPSLVLMQIVLSRLRTKQFTIWRLTPFCVNQDKVMNMKLLIPHIWTVCSGTDMYLIFLPSLIRMPRTKLWNRHYFISSKLTWERFVLSDDSQNSRSDSASGAWDPSIQLAASWLGGLTIQHEVDTIFNWMALKLLWSQILQCCELPCSVHNKFSVVCPAQRKRNLKLRWDIQAGLDKFCLDFSENWSSLLINQTLSQEMHLKMSSFVPFVWISLLLNNVPVDSPIAELKTKNRFLAFTWWKWALSLASYYRINLCFNAGKHIWVWWQNYHAACWDWESTICISMVYVSVQLDVTSR